MTNGNAVRVNAMLIAQKVIGLGLASLSHLRRLSQTLGQTVRTIVKAKKKPLEEKSLADLGLNAAEFGTAARKVKIIELTPPPPREAGKIVAGETAQERAVELARLLHEEAKII